MTDATDLGEFGPHAVEDQVGDEDISKYFTLFPEGSPTSDTSSPTSSPPRMFEDTSTDDSSPAHWSQDLLTPPVVPQLNDQYAIDLYLFISTFLWWHSLLFQVEILN